MKRNCPLARTLCLVALLPNALFGLEITNADLFNKSAKAAWEAISAYELYEDPEEVARLNRIGYELAQASGYTEFPFSFYLVDMAIPNAGVSVTSVDRIDCCTTNSRAALTGGAPGLGGNEWSHTIDINAVNSMLWRCVVTLSRGCAHGLCTYP